MSTRELVIDPGLQAVPTYVRGKSIRELKQELGIMEVVKLGSNENPLGPSPAAVKAVRQAATEMHRYPGISAHDLRCRLAESLDSGLDADNIIVGNGSADVILSMAKAFLSGGGEVLISHPAFQIYELAASLHGGKPVFVEPTGYGYDLDAMADAINERTRLVFVTNPNNPTGLIVTRPQVEAFMHRVPPSAVVVFDEAYFEYVDEPAYPDAIDYVREGRNVIITRTFSKVYGLAGMRIGYGIARRELITPLIRTQPPFHHGRLSLVAALASLDDRAYVARAQQANAEGRAYLYRSFEALNLRYLPSQTNFVMLIDLPHRAEKINQALLERGVIIRPTDSFGIPEALRVTVGTQSENERLVNALGEVLAKLEQEPGGDGQGLSSAESAGGGDQ